VGGYKFRELSFSLAWSGEEYICIAPKLGLATSAARHSKPPGLDDNKTQLKRCKPHSRLPDKKPIQNEQAYKGNDNRNTKCDLSDSALS